MKKWYRLLLCLGLLLLAGCGTEKETELKTGAEPTVADVQGAASDGQSQPEPTVDAQSGQGGAQGETSDEQSLPEPTVDAQAEQGGAQAETEWKITGDLALSHASGLYAEAFTLTINGGGEIYYTLDGSDPRTSETRQPYTEPLTVSDTKGTPLTVAAVDPLLISGSFCYVDQTKDGFSSYVSAPSSRVVDRCTVLRVTRKEASGYTAPLTATYFVGDSQSHISGLAESCAAAGRPLAVISIGMEYDDLFDYDTGIYVKGRRFNKALEEFLAGDEFISGETARSLDANYKQRGREWERNAHMDFFEFDVDGAAHILAQDCGIRVQGNYSRSDWQKGLRLYARAEYGENRFRYAVFGDTLTDTNGVVIDSFKRLVLRAGGNCAFLAKFNDTYWQSLLSELACDTKTSRPCVVYVNGEYFGLYVLEEDYSSHYFEDHYGVDNNAVVVYKGDADTYELGYKLDEGVLPVGVTETDYYFQELLAFFDTHKNLSEAADYEAFEQLVAVESVRDYFAAQVWINNKWDWPGKNWSMWKTATIDATNPYADGRWRFSIYDVEFGGISGASDARTNTIKEDNYMPLGLLDMDTENPAVLCFAYLMTNEAFRADFYAKLLSLSEGCLEQTHALERLAYFSDTYGPLLPQFFMRYPDSGDAEQALSGGYGSVACLEAFLKNRAEHLKVIIDWTEQQYAQ